MSRAPGTPAESRTMHHLLSMLLSIAQAIGALARTVGTR
jgi:hypothetical protein